jgi:hypothetical protein
VSALFQALHDNISTRFPDSGMMTDAMVLDKASWPDHPLQRALYGKLQLQDCKQFCITGTDAAQIVLDFSMYKQGKAMTARLGAFVQTLNVLPVSSAACERGFSQLNLQHTAVRNRLTISSISNLLMISINGPCLRDWNAKKYVLSWLKSGRHGALDKPTGRRSKAPEKKNAARLFA